MMHVTSKALSAVFAVSVAVAQPALAADSPELKSAIDALIHRVEGSTQGVVKWDGADKMEAHPDGNATVVEIVNGRVVIDPAAADKDKPAAGAKPKPAARVTLDRIEVRRTSGPDNTLDFVVGLPHEATVRADDQEVKLTFKDAKVHAVLDAQSERAREMSLGFAEARVDVPKEGSWVTFGPLTSGYKLEAASDGSWKAPTSFELKKIELFAAKGPGGGTIDRIAVTGGASGPDIAALNSMRDKLNAVQQSDLPPDERGKAVLKLLPEMFAVYGLGEAQLTLDNLAVRVASVPLVTLAKASFGIQFTGLAKDTASLRLTLKHDGLKLDPSIPNAEKVPTSANIDIGLEEIASGPLRTVLDLASKMASASPEEQQKLTGQMMGAGATLTPALRLHDLAFETAAVGLDAKAEAKGSPLSPKGYSAGGDVSVRGFDAIPQLVSVPQIANYVALLTVLGTSGNGPDGKPATQFHLASVPPKWIEVNGNDVSGWFTPNPPNGPRRLRLADPAMTGDDVRAVQRALAAKKVDGAPAAPTGNYDGATAAAVARFQKQSAMNVDGTVDAATRDKLGVAAASPAPAQPGAPNAGAPKVAPAQPGAPPRVSPARPGN